MDTTFNFHQTHASFWLNERQVSELTGISRSTLQKHRFKVIGIPYSKIGTRVHYSYDAVQTYMQAHAIPVRQI